MAKQAPIGLMACPECGFEDAEVKKTKGGLAYRWCPECNAQYFPRKQEQAAKLEARMRPVTGAAPVTVSEEKAAAPAGVAAPDTKQPALAGFDLGL